jgi:hypothetical protein
MWRKEAPGKVQAVGYAERHINAVGYNETNQVQPEKLVKYSLGQLKGCKGCRQYSH